MNPLLESCPQNDPRKCKTGWYDLDVPDWDGRGRLAIAAHGFLRLCGDAIVARRFDSLGGPDIIDVTEGKGLVTNELGQAFLRHDLPEEKQPVDPLSGWAAMGIQSNPFSGIRHVVIATTLQEGHNLNAIFWTVESLKRYQAVPIFILLGSDFSALSEISWPDGVTILVTDPNSKKILDDIFWDDPEVKVFE